MKAAEANMAEVELGKLAASKAGSSDVKSFAQMMVDDHSKALTELKTLAQQKNLKWSTNLDHKDLALKEKLSKLSGPEFDRVYMQAMVSGHRNVANEVRNESKSGKDPDAKAWAAKTLPTVEEHLKKAEDVNKTIAKSTNSTH
jgi:putative membrane protein